MDVYVLSSKKGIIGVYSTLNAAKVAVELMIWTTSEDGVFEGRADWGDKKPTYIINQMKMRM